jgi:hypothetical protein
MKAAFTAASLALAVASLAAARAGAQTQPPAFDAPAQSAGSAPASAPRPAPPPAAAPQRQPGPSPSPKPAARPEPLQPGEEAIDDPKVSRRLGTRFSVPPRANDTPAAAPTPPAPAPVARRSPPPAPVAPPPVAPPPVAPIPAAPPSAELEGAGVPAIERPYTPPAEGQFEPTLPRLKLGLRRFEFVRVGASNSSDGVAAPETFNDISVDVYPVSRTVRIGLTSAFGWQSGKFLVEGDYFATQTVSLGLQYRDFGRVVPFAEGFAGVGYMRRLQFERTIPTAFWQFGVDAGAEVYMARVGYVSFALGYLRPINGFAKRQQFTSVFVDTWSFKLGIGI